MLDDHKRHYIKDGVKKEVEKPHNEREDITNRRGKVVVPRKYHMTKKQEKSFRIKFDNEIKGVSKAIKETAGSKFMNTYRRAGIYYGCIQSLYLLGCNKWHKFLPIFLKIEKVMSCVENKDGQTAWYRFNTKSPRSVDNKVVTTAKDVKGRIEQNMRVLQRLGGLHPYGMKLLQVNSCIDIRRMKDSKFEYRLRTDIIGDVTPVLDLSACPNFRKGKKVTVNIVVKKDKVSV